MKTVVVVSPLYQHLSQFVHAIPDVFSTEGVPIYKARNEIKNFTIEGKTYTVKSYKKPHIINKIAYGIFRLSKAKRAFLYAQRLLENNISTPAPIACIEQYKAGLLSQSYFVSEFAPDPHILRELNDYQIDGNEELLKALAGFTAMVHSKQVYPIDYSPGNVLFDNIDGQYRFTLLDINRMQFGNVSEKMATRCFRRFHMKRDMLEYIAREYALLREYEPSKFVRETVKHHANFWQRH